MVAMRAIQVFLMVTFTASSATRFRQIGSSRNAFNNAHGTRNVVAHIFDETRKDFREKPNDVLKFIVSKSWKREKFKLPEPVSREKSYGYDDPYFVELVSFKDDYRTLKTDDFFQNYEENLFNEVLQEENSDLSGSVQLRSCDDTQPRIDPNSIKLSLNSLLYKSIVNIQKKICQKLNYNPCYLKDVAPFQLSRESRFDDRQVMVSLEGGQIYGLSDFIADYNVENRSLELMLKWKNLQVHYRFTTDERGKKDTRDIDVYVPPLKISVRKEGSKSSLVEITELPDLKYALTDPAPLTYDTERAFEAVKDRSEKFLDKNLRYFLWRSVKEALDDFHKKNVAKFCQISF